MLAGELPADAQPAAHPAPWYRRPAADNTADIALIGGGVASALTALALLRRGATVTLYCADEQAAEGASGNRQGAIYPLLNGSGDALESFFSAAFPSPAASTTRCCNKASPLIISGAASASWPMTTRAALRSPIC